MLDSYTVLVTVHVVLFAYWLGPDLGVYVCSRYVANPELPTAERLRFLEALLAIDILPRSAIVLLPVVGLQLAVMRGSIELPAWALVLAWVAGAAWLALVWTVYRTTRKPEGVRWQRVDVGVRLVLIPLLVLIGVYSLLTGSPVATGWVAWKLIVYAALLAMGLYLRTIIKAWRAGFTRLAAGEQGPDIDALFVDGRRRARYGAWTFWALIIAMAFLGITQPL